MPETFTLEVVTPERVVFREPVQAVIVPGAQGQIGVLPDHAPMVVNLKAGVVKYRQSGQIKRMAVSGGLFEVSGDKAVILADAAELAGEIDVLRAKEARRRAEERLRARTENIDIARAHASLERALARLRAAGEI